MTINENEQKRYELLEYIDYLAQISKDVRLESRPPGIKDADPILIGAWLNDLEERKLISSLRGFRFPGKKLEEGDIEFDWFTFKVSEEFNAYVDEFYRYIHLSIEGLSQSNFAAVLDAAYEIQKKLEVTQSNHVLISSISKKFPQLTANSAEARIDALNFLKEYGAITDYAIKETQDGSERFSVSLTRRVFDRTYRTIITKAVQDGFAIYNKDPLTTKALAEESKRRQKAANKPEDKPLGSSTPIKKSSGNDKVHFDSKSSNLVYNNLTCDIPDETLEHYVCKLAFRNRRLAVKEVDILEAFNKSQDSKRPVYDAMLRVNKKAKADLKLEKLLTCKASKIRVNKIHQ